MTQEDKELLLKDLCARLPYGVVVRTWYGKRINIKCISVNVYTNAVELDIPEDDDAKVFIDNVKPYLFPLSSMSDEQKREFEDILIKLNLKAISDEIGSEVITSYEIDFYNKNHFDYRGLIERGIALDATGLDIYK